MDKLAVLPSCAIRTNKSIFEIERGHLELLCRVRIQAI